MPRKQQDWTFIFGEFSTSLARQTPLTLMTVKEKLQEINLSEWTEKQLLKGALSITLKYRVRGQFGRLRAAILVGTTICGSNFITKIERAQVFLDEDIWFKKFTDFLVSLRSEVSGSVNDDWGFLRRRLDTYISFRQLAAVIAKPERDILPMLQIQPRHAIHKVLSLTNLAFLHAYFEFEIDQSLSRWLDELGSPEDIASIASILIALACEQRALDSFDLAPPMGTELATPEVRRLMEYGKAKMFCHEVGKDISFFGYELEKTGPDPGHVVFYVRPPSANFEYGRRLGFIRSEIGLSKARLAVNTKDQVSKFSLSSAAGAFASRFRHELQDIRDDHTPFRRVRIIYRTGPKMFEVISQTRFYEDEGDIERSSQDFLAPMISQRGEKIRLTDRLDLETFINIWRYFQFLCLVDIHVLRPFAARDRVMLANSLIRVAKEADDIELLTSAGISDEQAQEFLQLVSADTRNLGYYDIQYRPFIRIRQATIGEVTSPPEIIHVPGIVGTANFFRNVQVANKIRIAANAEFFVEAVAHILETRFDRVCTNRHVKGVAGETDIDVAVLAGKNLFIFECKHSVPPTSPHEMRDIWEDIEKAANQLRTAMAALSSPTRLGRI